MANGTVKASPFFLSSFPTSPSQAYNLAIKKSSFLLEPVIAVNLLRAVPLPESIQTCLLLLAKTNLQVLLILSTPRALLFNSCVSQTLKINGSLNSYRVMFCVKNRSLDKVHHQQPLYPSEQSNSGCCHVQKQITFAYFKLYFPSIGYFLFIRMTHIGMRVYFFHVWKHNTNSRNLFVDSYIF